MGPIEDSGSCSPCSQYHCPIKFEEVIPFTRGKLISRNVKAIIVIVFMVRGSSQNTYPGLPG